MSGRLLANHLKVRDEINCHRGHDAPLVCQLPVRRFEDVYPAKLAKLFDMGWFLAGSAALYLAEKKRVWVPRDLDFYTKADFGTRDLTATLEFLQLEFSSNNIVVSVANGLAQVTLLDHDLDLQFILAPVPAPYIPYLLYNFDISVCAVAMQATYMVIMTPLAADNIKTGVIDVCPQMIGDFAEERLGKYFRRGFGVRVTDLSTIYFANLMFLLTESSGVVHQNEFFPSKTKPLDSDKLRMAPPNWRCTCFRPGLLLKLDSVVETARLCWRGFDFAAYWRRRHDALKLSRTSVSRLEPAHNYGGFLVEEEDDACRHRI